MRFDNYPRQRGVTLVEMMIALTVSLLLIAAMAQVFQMIGDGINTGRSVLELQGRLRSTMRLLEEDLKGITVPLRPYPDAISAYGYFEYYEGPSSDANSNANFSGGTPVLDAGESNFNTSQGDLDDILMFTARSTNKPFRGRVLGQLIPETDGTMTLINPGHPLYDSSRPPVTLIESEVAEIVWWTVFNDLDGDGEIDTQTGESMNLYRRVFLIRPDITVNDVGHSGATLTNMFLNRRDEFYSLNDLSLFFDTTVTSPAGGVLLTNSLQSVMRRENRFGHVRDTAAVAYPATFPHPIARALLTAKVRGITDSSGNVQDIGPIGEDVVANHVLAFDIKAYDPYAPLQGLGGASGSPGDAVSPSDPGYNFSGGATPIGLGAFVDLYYTKGYGAVVGAPYFRQSFLSRPPTTKSRLTGSIVPAVPFAATYDTWTFDYEHDGINQDLQFDIAQGQGSGLVDEGSDGLDILNPVTFIGANGIDDNSERETSPPYNHPLRGLQVTIRVMEPDSRQVRQTSVVIDFTPE